MLSGFFCLSSSDKDIWMVLRKFLVLSFRTLEGLLGNLEYGSKDLPFVLFTDPEAIGSWERIFFTLSNMFSSRSTSCEVSDSLEVECLLDFLLFFLSLLHFLMSLLFTPWRYV